MKRALDVSVAGLGLVVLSPVLLILVAIVRLDVGSPVFFTQIRPGLHGKPFRLVKLRTMRDTRDPAGNPLHDRERVTRIGRFLRSSSLDELPELWNVFKGDMSLVGPRPLLMKYLPLYTREQARRHEVRPGVTGWAQVNGRNAISWEERFRLDVWYVDHRSFVLDMRILLLTVLRVAARRGITPTGSDKMPAFTGTRE